MHFNIPLNYRRRAVIMFRLALNSHNKVTSINSLLYNGC